MGSYSAERKESELRRMLVPESLHISILVKETGIPENESSELDAEFVEQACLCEKTLGQPLILHSDNGSPMKGSTLVA